MKKRDYRIRNKALKDLERIVKIQALDPEGAKQSVIIESLLTGLRLNVSVPGTINAYKTYDTQVTETYKKYNGLSDFGCQQTRAIIDLRTAFIAGEGISISCEDEKTSDWIEKFLAQNEMNGLNFINSVKASEICGQSLIVLKQDKWYDDSPYVRIRRIPYSADTPYKPVYADKLYKDEIVDIKIKSGQEWTSLDSKDYIYIRTGGDDSNSEKPVTKVGVVLTDLENYDRALKDMRRNNHIFARITPVWETGGDSETKALKTSLDATKWKIGEAFIGKAKFNYVTPGEGAHQNLTSELVATIKTISAVTGIPVHWLGYVDLMSNRATADTLYELIKNATIIDRQIWENSLYNLILKAQEIYINNGGEELNKLNADYEVRLPLIDFNEFLNRVKGLNLSYMDGAISLDDYRNALPGIDPLKTKRALEKEENEEKESLKSMANNTPTEEFEEE